MEDDMERRGVIRCRGDKKKDTDADAVGGEHERA